MIRATIFSPTLSQFTAKGISPDDMKTMSKGEIITQTNINNSFNARAVVLGEILESKLKDIDMTWCKDGCIVISFDNSIAEIEQLIEDEGLEIREDRPEIKHKVRPLDPNDNSIGSEEDIDEVFEPLTVC